MNPDSGTGKSCLSFNIAPEGLNFLVTSKFLGGGPFRIVTRKWPNWFVYMDKPSKWFDSYSAVKGCQGLPNDRQGGFIFTPVQGAEYYLIATNEPEKRYLYMQYSPKGTVQGYNGDPGSSGHWLITPRSDGSFMLSTEKWPNWYMCLKTDDSVELLACKGDPGERGYFVLSCNLKISNL